MGREDASFKEREKEMETQDARLQDTRPEWQVYPFVNPASRYPIPNTQYPMPNTQYPMPNTQYPMPLLLPLDS
jgi:hypothetical protein